MPGYRLFCRNEEGRIFRSEEFLADDDEKAVEQAQLLREGSRAEVWTGKRLVREIEARG